MNAAAMTAGQAAMQTGYAFSRSILLDAMANCAPDQLTAWNCLRAATEPEILVVDGHFDHMHHVLEASQIPYARLADAKQFSAALRELPRTRAVLINCAKRFPADQVSQVARFVEAGGLLMTSDWALKNVIEPAFPNTIRHNGQKTNGNVFVDVELVGLRTPLLQTAFNAAGDTPKWWLEAASYPIERLSEGVEILMYSRQLKARYGNGSVMVAFPWGSGKVWHMISHAFLQQKGPSEPGWKKMTTMVFTTNMGTSLGVQKAVEEAERANPDFDGTVAAATTISTAAFLAPLLDLSKRK
jgi:hypothetical protein